MLLFRLILLVLAAAGLAFAWRRRADLLAWVAKELVARRGSPSFPPRLTEAEVTGLWALEAAPVAGALELRGRIFELAGPGEEALRSQVDEVVRHLGRQADVQQRLRRALAERRPGELDATLAEAQGRLSGAEGEEARALARQAVAGLELRREHLTRLNERTAEVETVVSTLLVALGNVHLALVDAAASRAAAKSGALGQVRARLDEASTDLERRTRAEEEVERLLVAGG